MQVYIDAVRDFCATANVPMVTVNFVPMGRIAGRYWPGKNLIEFNPLYIKGEYAVDEQVFINDTVAHEVAHHIDYVQNGNKIRRHPSGKRDMHGKYFKAILAKLGSNSKTKHAYTMPGFKYACACSKPLNLTKIIHNKIQRGQLRCCNMCNTEISKENYIAS